jgi:hypothetical protein
MDNFEYFLTIARGFAPAVPADKPARANAEAVRSADRRSVIATPSGGAGSQAHGAVAGADEDDLAACC